MKSFFKPTFRGSDLSILVVVVLDNKDKLIPVTWLHPLLCGRKKKLVSIGRVWCNTDGSRSKIKQSICHMLAYFEYIYGCNQCRGGYVLQSNVRMQSAALKTLWRGTPLQPLMDPALGFCSGGVVRTEGGAGFRIVLETFDCTFLIFAAAFIRCRKLEKKLFFTLNPLVEW